MGEGFPSRKRLKYRLLYLSAKAVMFLIRSAPRQVAVGIGGMIGLGVFGLLKRERTRAIQGIARVFGDRLDASAVRGLARRSFILLGRNTADAVFFAGRPGSLLRYVRFDGLGNFDAALAQGKGCIGITGHIGSWELLASALAAKGYPLNVVARDLRDARLNDLVVSIRKGSGVRVISRGRQTREILRALGRNEVVGLLIDQDTTVDGAFVDFLGAPAYTPAGPVQLSLRTGAPIVPAAILRDSDGCHTVQVGQAVRLDTSGDPADALVRNIAGCSQAVERFILQAPEQWVWFHRRWRQAATNR